MIKLMKNTFYNEKITIKKLLEFISHKEILSMSDKCSEFEKNFASYQERKYAVFFNSGSSANLAVIQALLNLKSIKKSDRVGFSALTWATNVMPLIQLGLKAIPIDVSLKNLNVDIEQLQKLKKKLKVFFLTNLLGFCGQIDKIKEFCHKNKIILVEDNCESLGSVYQGKKLGNFGLASTFSFFVGHHLSTIEGGMVCTDNKSLYEMLVMVRAHGWSRNVTPETKINLKNKFKINDFYEKYTFYHLGYNFRPMEIQGFLGCEQLKYINEICNKREKNFHRYQNASSNNHDFLKLDFKHMQFISNFDYPVICKNKNILRKYLKLFSNVEVRPIVGGSIVEQPFFKNQKKGLLEMSILLNPGILTIVFL